MAMLIGIPDREPSDDQVEIPVTVVIEECTRRTPMVRLGIEASGRRSVGERAVAIVVIESIRAEAGDEDVGQTHVVGIADGHAMRVSAAQKSAGVRHFLKRSIRLLMVKPIWNGLVELARRPVQDLQNIE